MLSCSQQRTTTCRRARLRSSARSRKNVRLLRAQASPWRANPIVDRMLIEQFRELLGHDAAEFFSVYDSDGAAVIARDVVADADCDQFDRRAGFDIFNHPAQVAFQIVAGID